MESNYYILTTRHGYVSVNLLHQWLIEENLNIKLIKKLYGKELRAKKKNYSIISKDKIEYTDNISLKDDDFLFRWGARSVIQENKAIVFNKTEALKLASDKRKFRQLMINNFIKVPFSVTTIDTLSFLDYSESIVIRPEKHRAGLRYYEANTETKAKEVIRKYFPNEKWYASEYFPKNREFRVQYALGKIISIKEKPRPGNGNNRGPWNYALNEDEWTYINWSDYNINMVKEVIKAADIMGLDICAFDVMVNGKDFSILEANTAPTLSPYTINRYAHLFKGIIEGKINPFDRVKNSTNPKDYVWKNKHLNIKKNK